MGREHSAIFYLNSATNGYLDFCFLFSIFEVPFYIGFTVCRIGAFLGFLRVLEPFFFLKNRNFNR